MKPHVLLAAELPEFLALPLAEACECRVLADLASAAVAAALRGMIVTGGTKVTTELLDRLPHLEIISVFGVGCDGVPIQECVRRGIRVTNTPDVLTDDVADIALALVLLTSRRLHAADQFVRDGRWQRGPFPLGHSLRGKRAGILGLGRIGQAIAHRLEAVGMRISYHNRRPRAEPWIFLPSVEQLARESDFLIVSCPGGPETRHLIDADILGALGSEGTLINVSRGSVVDEVALVGALRSGAIRAAGLDVYEHEPSVPEALLACENALLLPHVGSATWKTRKAMARLVLDNLAAHFAGLPLPNAVC